MLQKVKIIKIIAFSLVTIIALTACFYPIHRPENSNEHFNAGDISWMLISSAMVMIMTPGLSFFYGGMVNKKNVVSTMLQSFMALGIISLLWYTVGFSLAFGDSIGGWIGDPRTYFMMNNVGTASNPKLSPSIPFILFAVFQMKFAIITPAIITGSFAERVRFWSYIIFMCLFSLLIYCPIAHWSWHPSGFLHQWGVIDFAGGTVVHISSGVAAFAGAIFLGKRKIITHNKPNIPFVLLGTGLLWFGWFGFNSGSALGANSLATHSMFTTNLASATAMITWVLFESIKGNKPSAIGACIGAVIGLVAITPSAGFVDYGSSIFIGFITSVICNVAVHLTTKSEIDDTLDVFPCHGVGGMVGMLLTAVFAKEIGIIAGKTDLLVAHLIGLVVVVAFSFFGSLTIFWITNKITPMRVSLVSEKKGLDVSQHNETIVES